MRRCILRVWPPQAHATQTDTQSLCPQQLLALSLVQHTVTCSRCCHSIVVCVVVVPFTSLSPPFLADPPLTLLSTQLLGLQVPVMGVGAWSWGDRSGYWGYGKGYGELEQQQHS